MNVRKIFSWGKPEIESEAQASQTVVTSNESKLLEAVNDPLENIVPIQSVFRDERALEISQQSNQPKGLMKTPELNAFFSENYFGLGRHNGSYFGTQDALELGKKSLISKFQNTLACVLSDIEAKLNKLERELIRIRGLSPSASQQLEQACEYLKQEISTLKYQINDADNQKGWVLPALNDYHIGFLKGLSGALAFEQLLA